MNESYEDELAYDESIEQEMKKLEREDRLVKRAVLIGTSFHCIDRTFQLERSENVYVVQDRHSEAARHLDSLCFDTDQLGETPVEKSKNRMTARALLGYAMAAASLMSGRVRDGVHRISPGAASKSERISARRMSGGQLYTHTKKPGLSHSGAKRTKAKAKGVATAKARGAYRSAKK